METLEKLKETADEAIEKMKDNGVYFGVREVEGFDKDLAAIDNYIQTLETELNHKRSKFHRVERLLEQMKETTSHSGAEWITFSYEPWAAKELKEQLILLLELASCKL